ncbi:MAG: hypothetical protein U0930_04745 [Pirellulales bacterium]
MTQPGNIWSISDINAAELASGDASIAVASAVEPGISFSNYYTITFSGVAPGDYDLVLKIGSTIVAGAEVTVTANGWFERSQNVNQAVTEILDRISGGSVSWNAPVLETGQLSEPIIIGDDYLISVNRAFDWFVDPLPIPVGQATCWFGGKSQSKPPGWNVQGAVSEVTIDSQIRWRLRFELPRSVTSQLKSGLYSWSAEVRGASSQVTRVLGSVNVVPKQTA